MAHSNLKKILFVTLGFALFGLVVFVTPIADAASAIVHLPIYPVQATFFWVGDHYSGTVFSGIGSGYDVQDNTPYTGWCVEYTSNGDPGTPNTTFTVNLYSTYDPQIPITLTKWGTHIIPWDQINYALNHRTGVPTADVETTIFRLVDGVTTTIPLYLDAVANGTGFVPGAGQVTAVILTNGSGINSGFNDGWQENIIEVKLTHTTAVTLSSFNASSTNTPILPANIPSPEIAFGALGVLTLLGGWVLMRRN